MDLELLDILVQIKKIRLKFAEFFFQHEMCSTIYLTEIFIFNLCKNLYKERGNKEGCFGLEVSDLAVHTTKKCFFFFPEQGRNNSLKV